MSRIFFNLVLMQLILCGSLMSQTNIPTSATAPGAPTVQVKRLPDTLHTTPANYLRSYTALKPIQDINQVNLGAAAGDISINTQYNDSYGRILQTISRQATPSQKDLITPVYYDEFGRSSVQYLPFAAQSGNTADGLFKKKPHQQDSLFYKALFPNEKFIYGEAFFDGSPLNLPVKSTAPGTSWAGKGVGISTVRRTNTNADSVRLWVINITGEDDIPSTSMLYLPGALMVLQVTDEAGNNTITYMDESGRTVLSKIQISSAPGTGHAGWLCTYYVYDEMGHLRSVIPPKAVEALNNATANWNLTANPSINTNLCFGYFFDSRGRVIMKRIPGMGKVYMVYDVRDRLVFVQDTKLRSQSQPQWAAILFDAQNRPVMSGLMNYSGTRATLQQTVTTQTTAPSNPNTGLKGDLILTGEKSGTYNAMRTVSMIDEFETTTNATFEANIVPGPGGDDGETSVVNDVSVNKNPIPNDATFTPLAVNYYDDYDWMAAAQTPLTSFLKTTNINSTNFITNYNASPEYAQPIAASYRIRGSLTGTKKFVLHSSTALLYVTIYDDHGRPIQASQTNYSGGTDVLTVQYAFSGRVLRTHLEHQKSGSNPQTHALLTKYTYDHTGRKLSVTKKLDANPEQTISQSSYNELGQLKSKILGSNIESQNYHYNIRGWLTGINQDYVNTSGSTANYFGESLSYDYGFTNNLVNGNIAGVKWKGAGDGIARAYGFTYDNAKRLKAAEFSQQNEGSTSWTNNKVDFSVSGLNYDASGNILSMKQRGLKLGGPTTIDSLTYQYFSNSNLLQKISDGIPDNSPMGDFKDTAITDDDYSYDANGNIIKDNNRHMHSPSNGPGATYNFLNKPDSIVLAGGGSISYSYDAGGTLLSKKVRDNAGIVKSYTYINGFVYLNDTLQYVLHEEGRIRYARKKNSTTGEIYYAFEYDYFIRDHLRNVRTVLTNGRDTATYAATMESRDSVVVAALFSNVYTPVNTVVTKPAAFDTDNNNQKVSRLNASSGVNKKTGPSLVLKVMAGDKVQISTFSYYNTPVQAPPQGVNILTEVVSALAGGIVTNSAGKLGSGDLTGIQNTLSPNVLQFLNNNRPYDNTKPKAYLTWILFDNQFNFVASNSSVKQVQPGSSKQPLVSPLQTISKNGYLYVYVSNESSQDVLFDDLTVKYFTGPLVQEQSYYPFGLQMAGISDKALLQLNTPQKFNAGSELEDEFGLNLYNTFYRKYDPQIGRFGGIDMLTEQNFSINPYQFGFNDPLLFNDPTGALSAQEMEHILESLFASPNGGTWSSYGGGGGSITMGNPDGGGTIKLFGSSDQAFGFAAAYMARNGMWASHPGWATSFRHAIRRYGTGSITPGMVEGYYTQSWGEMGVERYNIGADYSEDKDGFNLSFTESPDLTMNNLVSTIRSMSYMWDLFSGPNPDLLTTSNILGVLDAEGDAAELALRVQAKSFNITNAIVKEAASARTIKAARLAGTVSKVFGVAGSIATALEGATDGNGITLGDGVKITIGVITTFAGPVGFAYGLIDLGVGLFTGKTLTDRIGEYVDSF